MHTYSIDQVKSALKNLSKMIKDKNIDDSIFIALSRAFDADDSPVLSMIEEAFDSIDNNSKPSDQVYKELVPGDKAVYLQATHKEVFEFIKNCLSEFRMGEYGQSYKYERAKSLEPEFFYPRLFCVRICDVGHRAGKKYYFAKIVKNNGELDDIPLVCPEENIFASEEDIEAVKAIYLKNVDKSIAWLDEMLSVKIDDLRNVVKKLSQNIQLDMQDSLEAFDIYGLKGEKQDYDR